MYPVMDTSESELRALVERARGADPDAWEALYRRAYPRLFAYARRRVTTETQAEDVVSETMIRAMDRVSDFVWTGAGIDGWLFGITRNVVYESYRDSSRSTPMDPATVPESHELTPGPLDGIVQHEERELVMEAFGRLATSDQELLEMRVVSGLDSEQVASMTGRRPGAVRTAQSRALAKLRVEFEGLTT